MGVKEKRTKRQQQMMRREEGGWDEGAREDGREREEGGTQDHQKGGLNHSRTSYFLSQTHL